MKKNIWQTLGLSISVLFLGTSGILSAKSIGVENNTDQIKNETLNNFTLANISCPGSILTNTEINDILRVHNQARALVGVAPLTWDCNLANYAQKWASQDKWQHSTENDFKKGLPSIYQDVGENLAAIGGINRNIAIDGPKMWLTEKNNWNNNTARCAVGKVCGHYTQVVWRNTTKIGCGINRNSRVMGTQWKGKTQFLSCNYNPAGNFEGEKAY